MPSILGHQVKGAQRSFELSMTHPGDYSFDNLVAKEAKGCMRIRGPVAQRLRNVSEGETVNLKVT